MSETFLPKKVRTSHLTEFKNNGQKFSCITSYDFLTAGIFDEAGIDVILVGDSAANSALGYTTTLPITVDEMITFGRAVVAGASRALVVIDMPFGSYEQSPEIAVENAIRIMKATGASAVKLEGGENRAEHIARIVDAGIPVMAHIGFTPQSVNSLGGFKVQGKGAQAEQLLKDAKAVESAGAFAVVIEMVPAAVGQEITQALGIPTIGIGAGPETSGQILVWTDMAGLSDAKPNKFVKQFANLRQSLLDATSTYRDEISSGVFPGKEHSF